jgi:hypothetical protein
MSSFFPFSAYRHRTASSPDDRVLLVAFPMMVLSGISMFAFTGADRGWGRPLSALAFVVFFPSVILLFRLTSGFDPQQLWGS